MIVNYDRFDINILKLIQKNYDGINHYKKLRKNFEYIKRISNFECFYVVSAMRRIFKYENSLMLYVKNVELRKKIV